MSHKWGYNVAQQVRFKNSANVAFIGLQPYADAGGQSVFRAAFTTFQNGTTSLHHTCKPIQGSPGIDCTIMINGNYSHTYELKIEKAYETTWRGLVKDSVTDDMYLIGLWTLPPTTGNITNGNNGYIDYMPWSNTQTSPDCSTLPLAEVTMYDPFSYTEGVSGGRIDRVLEYGTCAGAMNFKNKTVDGGYDFTIGFLP
ncbi:hypothetical protein DFQ26_003867 [Actinomortierella ambigua]|nr:hypothetical protein DFQ26_003867 [Actinomortierella ambigua]